MRLRSLTLISILGLFALGAAPVGGATGPTPVQLEFLPPGPGGFMSPNISYHGTLAFDSPAVSARVVQVGAVKRLYVSTTKSLSVYNVTDPSLPLLMGYLPIYNWENEDVTVSKDGRWVLASDFTASFYTHVVEVVDLAGGLVALKPTGTELQGNHTIRCIDDACNWAYGSEGDVWDLSDKANPRDVGNWGNGGHAVEVDATGLVWTDTTPIRALDPWPDPKSPTEIARSDTASMSSKRTAYQHNNKRPFAADYRPRITPEDKADPNLRPGEILLGEGETNFTGTCGSDNGPFVTYSLKNFDQEGVAPFKVVDVFRPINGDYDGGDGDAAVNAMGCSGHWFDVSPLSTHDRIVTANGFYDHGTRIFEVDGKTAKIKQLGYFQPVVGSASASYWIDDEYIYTVDYYRGIDILQYDPSAPVPTRSDFRASWLAKAGAVSPATQVEQYVCRWAIRKVA